MHKDTFIENLMESYGDWMTSEKKDKVRGKAKMTSKLYPYKNMFSPIKINRLTLRNRLIMAPMGNINMCEETGRPNSKMIQYFTARAKGGVGLITTGLIPISHGIDNSITELGKLSMFPRIDRSRTVFAGWRDLAQGVHSYGSKIFLQATPGLGRVGPPTCLVNQMKFPVSASINPNFYIPQIPCMRLSDRKLKKIISNVGQAAADSKECGIDGIYLHGHEGYLLEQLTNPAFNRRKIGKYADWQRFGIDCIKEIRKRVGNRYPIMYRIDLSLALNETYGDLMNTTPGLKKFKNGRSIEDTLDYMKNLVKAGVDIFDVDLGCYDNWWLPHPPAGMPAGCFLDVSKLVKKHFEENKIISNAGIPVPIVGVGKLGYPDIAEKALIDGECDMVMLGRPLLADSDWCNKAYSGKVDEIRPCIGCQEGCINEFVNGGHPQCAVNPRTGHEDILPETLTITDSPKKIGVIGGGPAGVMFALNAHRRGHKVDLYEKTKKLGGRIVAGCIPEIKFDIANYLEYLENEVKKESKKEGFSLFLETEATPELLKSKKYDSIIFAGGSKEISPPFKGKEEMSIVQATELLTKKALLQGKEKIVIVGGGVVGCETAYWLSYEHNKDVTLIEMLPHFMDGVCTANRGHLLYYLKKKGVPLYNCSKVLGFEKGKVIIEKNISKNVPDPFNTWQPILPPNIPNPLEKKIEAKTVEERIDADLVVLAMGSSPSDELFFAAQRDNLAPECFIIGDSNAPGKVLEATRAAYRLAISI